MLQGVPLRLFYSGTTNPLSPANRCQAVASVRRRKPTPGNYLASPLIPLYERPTICSLVRVPAWTRWTLPRPLSPVGVARARAATGLAEREPIEPDSGVNQVGH